MNIYMQLIELMMSLSHLFQIILYKIENFENSIFLLLLKHGKACPYIKIYQNKQYSAFIQSGYKARFTFP